MGRIRRIYYQNAAYHVVVRGNNRQMILKAKEEKEAFLDSVEKYRERFKFKLYGLVVMDNHVHMLIETNKNNTISRIMQAILLSFSVKYRRKHGYVGHVWQGRFESRVIEGEGYILQCLEYIHANPVKAKIVDSPEHYPWSSYIIYEGKETELIGDRVVVKRYGDSSSKTF